MISVAEQSKIPLKNAASEQELYETLREHIGHTVLIRRQVIERVGVLQRISFRRGDFTDLERIIFSLGDTTEMKVVNRLHRVEVQIDGVWKVLNPGSESNREL